MARENHPAAAVIEFGLEPEAFQAGMPGVRPASAPVRFVFCGRLTPVKNVAAAVAALLALRSETSPFHFDIIGEGSERRRLEEMAAGASAGFTFHGEVSEEEKRRLLGAGDVFILSSPREGFSIATLEAMALGCAPLVVSDARQPNGALDFVHPEEEGLCVAPGGEAMREGLRRLLRDGELRLRLRRAAWTTARRYRIERQAGALLEFYEGRKPEGNS